jgi:hypothetical protein
MLIKVVPDGMTAERWGEYRKELINLYSAEVYGFAPPALLKVNHETVYSRVDWAGKATETEVKFELETENGGLSFPVHFVKPNREGKQPLIIYISFFPFPCGRFCPVEEIIDDGFALASFYYNDVSKDEDDGVNEKISKWAWAASRVMDYALTLDWADRERIFLVGHSRLGKTALWCAAQDERFAGAGVNESGCGGVAVFRDKQGERVADITRVFPYWFCEEFKKYAGREHEMPFEQSMLVSLVAPRLLAVCDAEEDIWCDPQSEYKSLHEAGAAYELLGAKGLGGKIGYNLRKGAHHLSREDWRFFLKHFRQTHA